MKISNYVSIQSIIDLIETVFVLIQVTTILIFCIRLLKNFIESSKNFRDALDISEVLCYNYISK